MKHKRTLVIDHLENKVMLSHVAMRLPVHHVAVHTPVHHVAVHTPVHHVAVNRPTASVIKADLAHSSARPVHGQSLALSVRPSLARIQATAQSSGSGFGGGGIDTTFSFILATQVGGVAQNALNFTSNTYQNVLFGSGGWKGIQQIANQFANTKDVNQLGADLSALSFRIPYGNQQLLQIWVDDLAALTDGTLTPPVSGITWDANDNFGNAVGDTLYADLQTYLEAGIGTSFNILKSVVNWNNSDDLLTYNGTVAANGTNNTTVTPPVS